MGSRLLRAGRDDGSETRVREWVEIVRDEVELRLSRVLESEDFARLARDLREERTDPYSAALAVLRDPERLARALSGKRDGSGS